MNELQNIDGFNAKIYGTAENPLFLAKDIAELIEHSRASEMLKTVDDDEKLMQPILASGQNRNMWFLTEDGLYEVLMSSKKPQAKVFKKKVKEILKSIRKHGAYMNNEVIEKTLTSPDFIIQLATKLKDEQEARLELEKENSQLSLELAEATEKTRYLDLILDSPDELIVKQIAQDYGISAVKFNQILNKLRIQYKQNNQWILYSKFQGKGYIKSRTFNYIGSDKKQHTRINTCWTQKGREFLYRKLKKAGYLPVVEQDVA
ncbi:MULTISPECIES: phage antirepressor KilAC domain-containing protein [unclassified Lactococcus]|uniref:phage antirepressor n=1 Tax=unclassified Lactococcus TaxID=2643510 RepID=UPI00143068B0|nr:MULTISPECIES: phage antirepressor KilAC domain-containing protein [unclassified Lactococcus]KAF6609759.1 phage antirepressor KilAC domain-containing protein [Lactococcus sp. EKM201L]KAF6612479.1 phage antirepressor KilAC domain-containing protein [Lactococcus sp. EKM203L]KAF6642967.1 phage antirepressor KilAC domain-containing protein [Lactococcus sp. EKM501L]KAF6646514.1 phage antirepressor KilAC domain-containing protein [Lactococcus sp. EKM502L]KAF6652565.1 phage antirepressor KilAC doma